MRVPLRLRAPINGFHFHFHTSPDTPAFNVLFDIEMSQPLSRSLIEDRSTQLRAELKQWERDFALSHSGRKAGREDIKQAPEIGPASLDPKAPVFF